MYFIHGTREVLMSLSHVLRSVFIMGAMVGLLSLMVSCEHYGAGGGGSHVQEAILHAMEAVEHGNMGHGKEVAKHAGVALEHAKMAQQESPNPHLKVAIEKLDSAVSYGEMGLVGGGTKAAEEAIVHLKQVK